MEILLIPCLFALIALVVPSNFMRQFSLAGSLVSLVAACIRVSSFDSTKFEAITSEHVTNFGLTFKMGYDGMSLFMIIQTART